VLKMKTTPDSITPDNEDSKDNKSSEDISPSKLNSRIKELEKELGKKESEIEFLKEKLTNNQDVLLDVIEDKKILKKQIEDFELKEIDSKLNNFRELQRKQHKIEHRLFITEKHLEEAREELNFRKKIINDMENRGILDYMMGTYPESLLKYNKRD
jgi:chromosome segregation ATPase